MNLVDRLEKLEALTGQGQVLQLIGWADGHVFAAIYGRETLAKVKGETDADFIKRASRYFEATL